MADHLAIEYLAGTYEQLGYKVVAMALRRFGPNAKKFRLEVAAVEAAFARVH